MTRDIQKHCNRVRFVLIYVLLLNWIVAAAKIIYGLFSKSASMTADGFHSFSDGASNIIGLIGISLSARPRDSDHPYGHKKYETLFSLGIAILLFAVTFNLIKTSIMRLFDPVHPVINLHSFMVMIITLGINIWVMRYEFNRGKSLKSDILIADSLHTKADILTSLLVIIALIAAKLGYPIFDPIVTLFIAVFIGWAGLGILKQASTVLCDAVMIVDLKKIEDIVTGIKGVKSCHKIRTRGRPDDINVDLHIQLAPDTHLTTAHKISYAIENAIKKEIPEVTDVLVHLEPQERGRYTQEGRYFV